MMSGCGILTNGKGTRREYCEFSLDELQVTPPGAPPKLGGHPPHPPQPFPISQHPKNPPGNL